MARNRDDYLNEEDEYERKNVYVPIDTFFKKEIGKEYDPFDEYEEEEMVVPLEF
jgi:hypothetical protein